MKIDVLTFQATSLCLNFLLVILYSVAHRSTGRRRYFRQWILGYLILHLGFFGFVFRSESTMLYGVIITHASILMWFYFWNSGIEDFFELSRRFNKYWIIVLAVIDAVIIFFFGKELEHHVFRGTFTGLLLIIGHWYMAWKILRSPTRMRFPLSKMVIGTLVVTGFVWLVRWISLLEIYLGSGVMQTTYDVITVYFISLVQTASGFAFVALSLYRGMEESKRNYERNLVSRRISGVSRYLGGIAHAVNTPLGNARMLISMPDFDDEKREMAQQSLNQAIDIFRVFQSTNGFGVRGWELRSLDKMMETVVRIFEVQDRLTPSQLSWKGDRHQMWVPTEKVVGILLELIENTLNHGYPSEKRPKINIDFMQTENPDTQTITYKDWGTGVDEEILPHLFDPYTSGVDGRLTEGMGLFSIYQLVTGNMNGSVETLIPEGGGFVLRISYPMIPENLADGI